MTQTVEAEREQIERMLEDDRRTIAAAEQRRSEHRRVARRAERALREARRALRRAAAGR